MVVLDPAIVGAVILGVIFLIILGILVARRVAINMKTGGSVTLTLASILLLSGLWCMLLSPMATYPWTSGILGILQRRPVKQAEKQS